MQDNLAEGTMAFRGATAVLVLTLVIPKVTEGAWEELQALFTLDCPFSMTRALLQLSQRHSWITQATGTLQKVFEFGPSAMSH